MRHLPLAGLTLLGAACSRAPIHPPPDPAYFHPTAEVVDRIESQLAGRSCIGSLDQWQRNYDYIRGDLTKVWFSFQQAGVHGYHAGRIIGSEGTAVDDGQFRLAFGIYDIASGRLTIDYCGWNRPAISIDGS